MPTKQARDCRVGDILLFKNEESRIITAIGPVGEVRLFHTTTLASTSTTPLMRSRSGAHRRRYSDAD